MTHDLQAGGMKPIDFYKARHLLSPEQYQAGDRFGGDYRRARRWIESRCDKDQPRAERCRVVLRKLDGLRPVVVAVVGEGQWPARWANGQGLPLDDGLRLLRAGLDALVAAYARVGVR